MVVQLAWFFFGFPVKLGVSVNMKPLWALQCPLLSSSKTTPLNPCVIYPPFYKEGVFVTCIFCTAALNKLETSLNNQLLLNNVCLESRLLHRKETCGPFYCYAFIHSDDELVRAGCGFHLSYDAGDFRRLCAVAAPKSGSVVGLDYKGVKEFQTQAICYWDKT